MKTRSLVLALAAVAAFASLAHARQHMPLVTDAMRVLAPLEVTEDGATFRFRAAAHDALRICVMPRTFGPERCTTVGEMRKTTRSGD
jgi:hypothetical protein